MRFWPFARKRSSRERLLDNMPEGGVVAEIGVWKGDFSEEILATKNPAELHLVDPWKFAANMPTRLYGGLAARSQADMDAIYAEVAERFKNRPEVIVHRRTSAELPEIFPEGRFDWIYVDGDHSFAAVLSDLKTCWPLIRIGGFLAGDDYTWHDKEEDGRQSVKNAVAAFAGRAGVSPKIIGNQFYFEKR